MPEAAKKRSWIKILALVLGLPMLALGSVMAIGPLRTGMINSLAAGGMPEGFALSVGGSSLFGGVGASDISIAAPGLDARINKVDVDFGTGLFSPTVVLDVITVDADVPVLAALAGSGEDDNAPDTPLDGAALAETLKSDLVDLRIGRIDVTITGVEGLKTAQVDQLKVTALGGIDGTATVLINDEWTLALSELTAGDQAALTMGVTAPDAINAAMRDVLKAETDAIDFDRFDLEIRGDILAQTWNVALKPIQNQGSGDEMAGDPWLTADLDVTNMQARAQGFIPTAAGLVTINIEGSGETDESAGASGGLAGAIKGRVVHPGADLTIEGSLGAAKSDIDVILSVNDVSALMAQVSDGPASESGGLPEQLAGTLIGRITATPDEISFHDGAIEAPFAALNLAARYGLASGEASVELGGTVDVAALGAATPVALADTTLPADGRAQAGAAGNTPMALAVEQVDMDLKAALKGSAAQISLLLDAGFARAETEATGTILGLRGLDIRSSITFLDEDYTLAAKIKEQAPLEMQGALSFVSATKGAADIGVDDIEISLVDGLIAKAQARADVSSDLLTNIARQSAGATTTLPAVRYRSDLIYANGKAVIQAIKLGLDREEITVTRLGLQTDDCLYEATDLAWRGADMSACVTAVDAEQGAARAAVNIQNLSTISAFALGNPDMLTGNLVGDMTFSGAWTAPQLDGKLALEKGRIAIELFRNPMPLDFAFTVSGSNSRYLITGDVASEGYGKGSARGLLRVARDEVNFVGNVNWPQLVSGQARARANANREYEGRLSFRTSQLEHLDQLLAVGTIPLESGILVVDGRVTSTLAERHVSGKVRLENIKTEVVPTLEWVEVGVDERDSLSDLVFTGSFNTNLLPSVNWVAEAGNDGVFLFDSEAIKPDALTAFGIDLPGLVGELHIWGQYDHGERTLVMGADPGSIGYKLESGATVSLISPLATISMDETFKGGVMNASLQIEDLPVRIQGKLQNMIPTEFGIYVDDVSAAKMRPLISQGLYATRLEDPKLERERRNYINRALRTGEVAHFEAGFTCDAVQAKSFNDCAKIGQPRIYGEVRDLMLPGAAGLPDTIVPLVRITNDGRGIKGVIPRIATTSGDAEGYLEIGIKDPFKVVTFGFDGGMDISFLRTLIDVAQLPVKLEAGAVLADMRGDVILPKEWVFDPAQLSAPTTKTAAAGGRPPEDRAKAAVEHLLADASGRVMHDVTPEAKPLSALPQVKLSGSFYGDRIRAYHETLGMIAIDGLALTATPDGQLRIDDRVEIQLEGLEMAVAGGADISVLDTIDPRLSVVASMDVERWMTLLDTPKGQVSGVVDVSFSLERAQKGFALDLGLDATKLELDPGLIGEAKPLEKPFGMKMTIAPGDATLLEIEATELDMGSWRADNIFQGHLVTDGLKGRWQIDDMPLGLLTKDRDLPVKLADTATLATRGTIDGRVIKGVIDTKGFDITGVDGPLVRMDTLEVIFNLDDGGADLTANAKLLGKSAIIPDPVDYQLTINARGEQYVETSLRVPVLDLSQLEPMKPGDMAKAAAEASTKAQPAVLQEPSETPPACGPDDPLRGKLFRDLDVILSDDPKLVGLPAADFKVEIGTLTMGVEGNRVSGPMTMQTVWKAGTKGARGAEGAGSGRFSLEMTDAESARKVVNLTADLRELNNTAYANARLEIAGMPMSALAPYQATLAPQGFFAVAGDFKGPVGLGLRAYNGSLLINGADLGLVTSDLLAMSLEKGAETQEASTSKGQKKKQKKRGRKAKTRKDDTGGFSLASQLRDVGVVVPLERFTLRSGLSRGRMVLEPLKVKSSALDVYVVGDLALFEGELAAHVAVRPLTGVFKKVASIPMSSIFVDRNVGFGWRVTGPLCGPQLDDVQAGMGGAIRDRMQQVESNADNGDAR